MRLWSNSDEDRNVRREEQRQYENDVFYEVWRGGGDPDRIDYDRVSENYQNGNSPEDTARVELKRQTPKPPSEEDPTP